MEQNRETLWNWTKENCFDYVKCMEQRDGVCVECCAQISDLLMVWQYCIWVNFSYTGDLLLQCGCRSLLIPALCYDNMCYWTPHIWCGSGDKLCKWDFYYALKSIKRQGNNHFYLGLNTTKAFFMLMWMKNKLYSFCIFIVFLYLLYILHWLN